MSRSLPLHPVTPRPLISSYICWRCQSKRSVSQKFIYKRDEGRRLWAQKAVEIRAGTRRSVFDVLKERGLFQAITGSEDAALETMLRTRVGVYVGVDPTAPSLHVGHMLPLMALFWMYIHGCNAVTLVGGSTARIGDPTGRTTDREEVTTTERKANMTAMHYQMRRIWTNLDRLTPKHGYKQDGHEVRAVLNNNTWWNALPLLDVLKLMGSCFRVNSMLGKDTVKTKLESGSGMSFSEFCYPIMQAWDWWQLYHTRGVQVQIGGSDQFGNITSGVEAVKHVVKSHPDPDIRYEDGVSVENAPFGFTTPLLTTASGDKFGKSAGNAIWLDEQMTSSFDLYGFFVGTHDNDVKRYLQLFTFLPMQEIDQLCSQQAQDPGKRIAHHALAYEFVRLIHGDEMADRVSKQHKASRSQSLSELLSSTEENAKSTKANPLLTHQDAEKRKQGTYANRSLNPFAPPIDANSGARGTMKITLPKSLIYMQPIARVLYAAGMVTSRSEGHKLVQNGGAYIGSHKGFQGNMSDSLNYTAAKLHDPAHTWSYVIRDSESGREDYATGEMTRGNEGEEGLLILRTGKWKVRLIRIVSDEAFEAMNIEPPPGWTEFKAEQIARRGKTAFFQREKEEELAQAEKNAKPQPDSSRKRLPPGSMMSKKPLVASRIPKSAPVPIEAEVEDFIDNLDDPDLDDDRAIHSNTPTRRPAQQRDSSETPDTTNPETDISSWDSFESRTRIKSYMKASWGTFKASQAKGAQYFRSKGASQDAVDAASWRGWYNSQRRWKDEDSSLKGRDNSASNQHK